MGVATYPDWVGTVKAAVSRPVTGGSPAARPRRRAAWRNGGPVPLSTYRACGAAGYAGAMDGVRRKLTDRTWEGTLSGYCVHVFDAGGGWHYCVIDARGGVKICRRAESQADGARRARA